MNDYLIYTGVLNLGYAVFDKIGTSLKKNTKKSFDMKAVLVGELKQELELKLEKTNIITEEKLALNKLYAEAEFYIVKTCEESKYRCLDFTKKVKNISIKSALGAAIMSGILLLVKYEFSGIFYSMYSLLLLPFFIIITLPYLYKQIVLYNLSLQANAIMEFVSKKQIETVIKETETVSVKEF